MFPIKNSSESRSRMAGSGAELQALVFNVVNYKFWCIWMKTFFLSHNMWSSVENGNELPLYEKQTDEKQ